MKRILSALLATACIAAATPAAFAADAHHFTVTKRASAIAPTGHGKGNAKASAPMAGAGKHFSGPMTKKQFAATKHGFAAAKLPKYPDRTKLQKP